MKTSVPLRLILTLAFLAVVLLPFTWGRETDATLPPPLGEASELNTLIYVYSDT